MMRLVIFIFGAFIFCAVDGSPYNLVNSHTSNEQCLEGPLFWCQSVETAISCDAVTYCEQNGWKEQTNTMSGNDYECIDCMNSTRTTNEQMLSVNKFIVQPILSQTCLLQDLKEETCNSYVEAFLPRLYDTLGFHLKTKDECIEKCSISESFESIRQNDILESEDDVPCSFCTTVFEDLKHYLRHISESQFTAKLEGFCKHLAVDKVECFIWVDTNSHKVYTFFTNFNSTKICHLMQICPMTQTEEIEQSNDFLIADPAIDSYEAIDDFIPINIQVNVRISPIEHTSISSENNLPQCKLCEVIIKKVQKEIGRDKSREHIKRALSHVCSAFPDPISRRKCKKFIAKNGDKIVDLVANGKAGIVICAAIGFCSQVHTRADDTLIKRDILPHDNENIPSKSYIFDALFSPQCLICEQVMEKVVKEIGQDKSKEHIKSVLEKACSAFHSHHLRKKCVNVIENDGDRIIDLIIKGETSKVICGAFGFCGANPFEITQWQNHNDITSQDYDVNENVSSIQCKLCEEVMERVQKEIGRDKSKEHIKSVLEKACSAFHSHHLKQKCVKIIENDGDRIIDLIIKGETTQVICGAFGFCAERQNAVPTISH